MLVHCWVGVSRCETYSVFPCFFHLVSGSLHSQILSGPVAVEDPESAATQISVVCNGDDWCLLAVFAAWTYSNMVHELSQRQSQAVLSALCSQQPTAQCVTIPHAAAVSKDNSEIIRMSMQKASG